MQTSCACKTWLELMQDANLVKSASVRALRHLLLGFLHLFGLLCQVILPVSSCGKVVNRVEKYFGGAPCLLLWKHLYSFLHGRPGLHRLIVTPSWLLPRGKQGPVPTKVRCLSTFNGWRYCRREANLQSHCILWFLRFRPLEPKVLSHRSFPWNLGGCSTQTSWTLKEFQCESYNDPLSKSWLRLFLPGSRISKEHCNF